MGFSPELWSFLNLNVTGMNAKEARRAFDGIPKLNGFEAWRKIVVPLEPKSAARISNLYDDVRRPTRAKNLLEFEARIEEWEQDITRYVECGGPELPQWEKCIIALKILPKDTPSTITIPLRKIQNYAELVTSVKDEVKFMNDAGMLTSSGGVNLMAERHAKENSEHREQADES